MQKWKKDLKCKGCPARAGCEFLQQSGIEKRELCVKAAKDLGRIELEREKEKAPSSGTIRKRLEGSGSEERKSLDVEEALRFEDFISDTPEEINTENVPVQYLEERSVRGGPEKFKLCLLWTCLKDGEDGPRYWEAEGISETEFKRLRKQGLRLLKNRLHGLSLAGLWWLDRNKRAWERCWQRWEAAGVHDSKEARCRFCGELLPYGEVLAPGSKAIEGKRITKARQYCSSHCKIYATSPRYSSCKIKKH